MAQSSSKIADAFFHDERGIVASIARVHIQHMVPAMRERGYQRQEGSTTNRVGEDDGAL